jgi:ATP-dependent Clp protease adapter protein ClpS
MDQKYEVVITVFEPHYQSVRMPALQTFSAAHTLGVAVQSAYPGALVEIAHDGIRECL